MDNRLLIGFGGFLAVFLLFPFVAQYMREGKVGNTEPVEQQAQTTTTAAKGGASKIPSDPPLLDSQTLVGTEWQFTFENYKIKITIAPNQVVYATHPLMRSVTGMDYFEGRWRLEYNRLHVEARFGDDYFDRWLVISGNDLYDEESGDKVLRYQ